MKKRCYNLVPNSNWVGPRLLIVALAFIVVTGGGCRRKIPKREMIDINRPRSEITEPITNGAVPTNQ